ncbi:hypothetical protein T02_9272 [Trichinella nativa]|uniref:Uncharacterized protein n=2 Tax=Trichinella TaxID=6333 RepID=A0A0V1KLR4_9BILA|nr:hypothetical protein T02_9272 [Trichinella nativa]
MSMRFAVCMKNPERFSENSLHSEFEAALTAILLGAVHRFLSALKANCSLKIFLAIDQRNLFSTSESFYLFRHEHGISKEFSCTYPLFYHLIK